jgi:sRNA-binding regulator protein Hfq
MLYIYLLHDIESWRNVFRSCFQIVDRYNLILSWLTSDHSKYALWAHLQYIYAYNICRNYMQFQDGVVKFNTRIVVQNMYNFGMSSLSCRMIVDKFKLRLTELTVFLTVESTHQPEGFGQRFRSFSISLKSAKIRCRFKHAISTWLVEVVWPTNYKIR